MGINENLKKLRETKNNNLKEKEYLKKKELEEIENSKKIIEEKYREDYKGLNEFFKINQSNISDECKLIEKYSIFNSHDIIPIIKDIINIYEGIEYIYKNTSYHVNPKRLILASEVAIFVKKDKAITKFGAVYPFQYFHSLKKHRDMFVLKYDGNYWNNKDIIFYKSDGNNVKETVKFSKFKYIKEFIDFVISYRIENNIEFILCEDLEKLKKSFIESKIDEIYKHHDELNKQDEKIYNEKLKNSKDKREKHLKRLLLKK